MFDYVDGRLDAKMEHEERKAREACFRAQYGGKLTEAEYRFRKLYGGAFEEKGFVRLSLSNIKDLYGGLSKSMNDLYGGLSKRMAL